MEESKFAKMAGSDNMEGDYNCNVDYKGNEPRIISWRATRVLYTPERVLSIYQM